MPNNHNLQCTLAVHIWWFCTLHIWTFSAAHLRSRVKSDLFYNNGDNSNTSARNLLYLPFHGLYHSICWKWTMYLNEPSEAHCKRGFCRVRLKCGGPWNQSPPLICYHHHHCQPYWNSLISSCMMTCAQMPCWLSHIWALYGSLQMLLTSWPRIEFLNPNKDFKEYAFNGRSIPG